jgi:hypothetical protein
MGNYICPPTLIPLSKKAIFASKTGLKDEQERIVDEKHEIPILNTKKLIRYDFGKKKKIGLFKIENAYYCGLIAKLLSYIIKTTKK